MKKVIFSLMVLLLVCTSLAFSQMTNTEIWRVIQMSKEANQKNGIKNPDSIFPGQILTFLFEDGIAMALVVEPGDSQWKIIRDKVSYWQSLHGPVVNYTEPDPVYTIEPIGFAWYQTNLIWLVPVLLAILLLSLKFISMWWKARNEDPVSAGKPQVPGGVSDSLAHQRMRQVVQNRFPGARMNIKNIRRGRLSGLAKIFYAEGKPKKIILKNTPAYAGEILVNNKEETIYFLQGCGNDARSGHFMSPEDLIFTPDAMINEDGSESQIQEPETPEPSSSIGSEFHQHVEGAQKMLVSYLKNNNAKHEVILSITRDSYSVTIKDWFDKDKKGKETVPEKKES